MSEGARQGAAGAGPGTASGGARGAPAGAGDRGGRRAAPTRPGTVLLVCHANTCRSVMAHVLLERMLAERGAPPVRVRSGGIAAHARDGMIPSLDARLVLREVGIHLGEADLTSTDLRRHPHLVAKADLILTMTGDQREALRAFPEARGRPILTLRELVGEAGDIADPFGSGEERYRATRDEIQRCLARGLDRILGALGS